MADSTAVTIDATNEISIVDLGAKLFATCQAAVASADAMTAILAEAPESRRAELVNGQEHPNRFTCLYMASIQGHAQLVENLVTVPGIDCNLRCADTTTALIVATILGKLEVVKILAAKGPGIDVNLADQVPSILSTPLLWAISKGHPDIVMFLAGLPDVDMNCVNAEGCTAIIVAAMHNNSTVFEFLLDHPRVDKALKGPHGIDLLMVAMKLNNVNIVSKVLQMKIGDVNCKLVDGTPSINCAVRQQASPEVMKLFLAQPGLDFSATDAAGKTALDDAVELKRYEVMLLLRQAMGITVPPEQAAAEASERIHSLVGCLHALNYYEQLQAPSTDIPALKTILEQWAGNSTVLNTKNGTEFSVCYNAARDGKAEVLDLLVATAGVDANICDSAGYSGLMWAASQNKGPAVEALLKAPSINLTLRTVATHQTALELTTDVAIKTAIRAAMMPEIAASEAAIEAAIAGGKEILSAAKANDTDALQILCKTWSGNDKALNLTDDNGSTIEANVDTYGGFLTPLMNVTSVEAATILLSTPGTNVNAQDLGGKTALIHHVINCRVDVVKLLIAVPGIDLAARTKKGTNVLEQVPVTDDQRLSFVESFGLLRQAMGIQLSPDEAAAEKNQVDLILAGRAVFAAAGTGDAEALAALINQHASSSTFVLNYKQEGKYPLVTAVENGHLACVKLLGECAAVDVNLFTEDSFPVTALMCAASKAKSDPSILTYLLSLIPRIDTSLKNKYDRTVLTSSESESVRDIVRAAMGIVLQGEELAQSAKIKVNETYRAKNAAGQCFADQNWQFDIPALQALVDEWGSNAEWRDVVFSQTDRYHGTPLWRAVGVYTQQLEAIAILVKIPRRSTNQRKDGL